MLKLERRQQILLFAAFTVVAVIGLFLRISPSAFHAGSPLHVMERLHPTPKFDGIGFDEGLYRAYVETLSKVGLGRYPEIVNHYIGLQKRLPGSILPPVRFLYVFTAYCWHALFGSEALDALHHVASFFSILTLFLSAIFAWRLKGPYWALGITALMAFAPTQIHMSQHALVDGFFTFWALLCMWLLWENLQTPKKVGGLVCYALSLSLLVLTKENAFFVLVALMLILLSNRWLKFGLVTRELLLATIVGPLLGVVILAFLAGGIAVLVTTYQLSVSKNYQLAYAVLTGDGPWYRYVIDLMLVSPLILILAIGTLFRLDRDQKPELFMSIFIGASYLVMCNIKYGMNLRYANIWDMPLRLLALSQIVFISRRIGHYPVAIASVAVGLTCAVEIRQYFILFVSYPLYELVSEGLLRALKILKSH